MKVFAETIIVIVFKNSLDVSNHSGKTSRGDANLHPIAGTDIVLVPESIRDVFHSQDFFDEGTDLMDRIGPDGESGSSSVFHLVQEHRINILHGQS